MHRLCGAVDQGPRTACGVASVAAMCGGAAAIGRDRGLGGGVFAQFGAAAVRAPAAAYDAEEEEAAETGGEPDDEREVAVDPGLNFTAHGAVDASAIFAGSSTGTTCAV